MKLTQGKALGGADTLVSAEAQGRKVKMRFRYTDAGGTYCTTDIWFSDAESVQLAKQLLKAADVANRRTAKELIKTGAQSPR